jgi:hypothetical protein
MSFLYLNFLKNKPSKSHLPDKAKKMKMKTKTIDLRIEGILLTVEYQYIPATSASRVGSPDTWSEVVDEEIYIESICVPLSNQNISELLDDDYITDIESLIHNLEQ